MKDKVETDCFGLGKLFLPGFRFHPTDEELVLFYLKGKIRRKIHGDDVIGETDVYKWDPEELPGLSKLKTGDRQWFFFCPRDRKYPNAARSSRATRNGYWKATGKDRVITSGSRPVGVKKTLVFYGGRAPNGERTDWVMHEYTMDEEELKRCQTAKDYYALYKVFKKSGPGPKNGEEYGAPFREEDWDYNELDVQCPVDRVIPSDENNPHGNDKNVICALSCSPIGLEEIMTQIADDRVIPSDENNPHGNDKSVICALSCSPIGLEEIMTQIADDPILVPPCVVDNGLSLDEFLSELENQSSVVSHFSCCTPSSVIKPCSQRTHLQSCFGFAQSDQMQSESEASDVLYQNVSGPENYIFEENLFEDFLEMNDLIDPEPTVQNLDLPVDKSEKLPFNEFDSLDELDMYQNVASFVDEMGPGDISQRQGNKCEIDVLEPNSTFFSNFESRSVGLNPETQFIYTDETSYLLSTDDQRCSNLSINKTNQGLIPSTAAGVVQQYQIQYQNRSDFVNFTTGTNENQNDKQDDGTTSWLSSVLWDFVESVPTSPALASENALVNRALRRMSSFGRIRINTQNMNVTTGNAAATSRTSGKSSSRFLFISLLGVFCAILWVLIGVSIKVMT